MGLGSGLLLTGFEDPGDKITVHSVWAEEEVGLEEQRSCTGVGSPARGRPRESNVSSSVLFLKALWDI